MTRLLLAAGVAAMAISAPVNAQRDRGDRPRAERSDRSAQRAERPQRMERQRAERPQRMQRAERPQRAERRASNQRMERPQRAERRASMQRMERPQRAERQQRMAMQRAERPQRAERQQRVERQQRLERQERMALQRAERPQRAERQRVRVAERQQVRPDRIQRMERQQARNNRMERVQRVADRQRPQFERAQRMERMADRQQFRRDRIDGSLIRNDFRNQRMAGNFDRKMLRDELRADRLMRRDALRADRQINRDTLNAYRQAAQQDFRTSRFASVLNYGSPNRIYAPVVVSQFVGQPLSALNGYGSYSAFPQSISYLYPDNDDYYYRYGGGYAYRIDRDNDLIDYILPLLAGGFMPGQYLPTSYMNSYVPNYYGLNSFYPASYGSYGGYGNDYGAYGYSAGYGYNDYDLCNRYYGGVVYQVDCDSGYIEDVVPLYAGGYGVGQMLPSSYSYYNVPSQYRSLYYDTGDQNYWYAPGAIYEYDRSSSLITSVAALLTPGFSVGQPLPSGYGMYNVPLGYRDTYYDTPNAWYRYNNGNIYQVDPTTQLVTAIVASILT